jgi:multiple RNA-binding domain-containing protein 1
MIKEKYGDPTDDKTSYKKKKRIEMRKRLEDTTNWNTLFLNPNTLLEHMAQKHGITKSEILLS